MAILSSQGRSPPSKAEAQLKVAPGSLMIIMKSKCLNDDMFPSFDAMETPFGQLLATFMCAFMCTSATADESMNDAT
jgi:hypothetical protein